jgi:hypothetical protein
MNRSDPRALAERSPHRPFAGARTGHEIAVLAALL